MTSAFAGRPLPGGFAVVPGFLPRLAPFSVDALAAQSNTVFALDERLRLAFLNPAWYAFAAANGGEAIAASWGLGRPVLDACPDVLRDFYRRALTGLLGGETTWRHEYECSSPETHRLLQMTVYPLRDGAGLLVVNAVVACGPHPAAEDPPTTADAAAYRDADGFVHQCAHCRKTRNPCGEEQWDWVPGWVARVPDDTSHDLCPACLDFHYPA